MKTLVNVRTACRLADRVQIALAQAGLQFMNRLEVGAALAQPLRKTGLRRRGINLY